MALGVDIDAERDQERGCGLRRGVKIDADRRLDDPQRHPWWARTVDLAGSASAQAPGPRRLSYGPVSGC